MAGSEDRRRVRFRFAGPGSGDFAAFATGTLVYQGARLLLSLVAAAVLGPEVFGVWTLFVLVVLYSNFASLGITNGAGREIPYLLGASQPDAARRVEGVTLLATCAFGLAAALLALVVGPIILGPETADLSLVLALSVAVLLQQFYLLQQVLLRSRFRFRSAAAQMAVLGGATILIGLPLLTFGLIGLAVSQVVVYVVALAMAARLLGGIPRPMWDPDIARRLVYVGLPIMLAGLLFGLLTTIDRWLILIYLDRVQVGYYGIVGITVSGLLLLPGIVSQQYYPRLAFAYGAGRGGEALLALASRQSLISGGLVCIAALAAAIVATLGIRRFLPEYQEAVVPLLITLIGLGIYGLGAAFGDLLNTIGAQRRYLAIQALVLAIDVALSVALLMSGLELVGVAIALTVSMTIYAVLLFASGRLLIRKMMTPPTTESGEWSGG